jgi:peptidoglycan hydrolase CwlO-like protein
MIKNYTDFLNEASVDTQIQELETQVSKLRDDIADAKKAVDSAGTPEAKKAAKVAALNAESTALATIAGLLRRISTLVASPEATKI